MIVRSVSFPLLARLLLVAILALGAGIRLYSARVSAPELLERDEYIPAANTITWDHHPIRVSQHGGVPHYGIRLSGMAFGESLFGFRLLSVILGTATILLLYLTATLWWGRSAGLVAAGLLSIERYHTEVTARAIDLPYDMFFIVVAVFLFSRFLRSITESDSKRMAGWCLYASFAAAALGFLSKELTALLVPVFVLTILVVRSSLLRTPAPWLALLLFLLIISPDLVANTTVEPQERVDQWMRHQEAARQLGFVIDSSRYPPSGLYMTYGNHLSRFHSIAFNSEPFYFYFGDVFDALGVEHSNRYSEFPYMHPVLAIVLWASMGTLLLRFNDRAMATFLTVAFLLQFVPFALIQLREPNGHFPTDSNMLWYWVDRTMFVAMLATGRFAALLTARLSHNRGPGFARAG